MKKNQFLLLSPQIMQMSPLDIRPRYEEKMKKPRFLVCGSFQPLNNRLSAVVFQFTKEKGAT